MSTPRQSKYITIPRKEYDHLLRAEVMLAAILRTDDLYRRSVVDAVQLALGGGLERRCQEEAVQE